MADDPLISVTGVGKRFCRRTDRALRYGMQDILRDLCLAAPSDRLREGEFWALRDVNLTVNRGDVIGLVGHNGAGKSTLLKLLAGIYRPSLGSIEVNTHKIAVLDHAAGLNPMQTGRESIFTKLALLGLQMAEITDRIEQIVAIAELQDVIDSAVSTYSTGMRVRLAFAMYSTVDIDVFIIDDSLGVADIRFAQRMQRYWQDFVSTGGTLLLASHEMYLMRALCSQAMLFDHGRIVSCGPTERVVGEYLTKYLPTAAPAVPTATPVPMRSPASPTEPALLLTSGHAARTPDDRRSDYLAANGEFPVRITAIETEALPMVGAGAAQTLGQLTVRMHCVSSVAFEQVKFGIELMNDQRQVAIHVYGPDQAPFFSLAPGANTLVATLRQLTLMPGDYKVCVGVQEQGTEAILGIRGWEEPGEPLRVLPAFQNDLLGAIARCALMPASVTWQLNADDATPARCAVCAAGLATGQPDALRAI